MAIFLVQSEFKEQVHRKTDQFYDDVVTGLSSIPKRLNSKYFYDANGDKLFQDLMDCEEYYPTKCEMDIFANRTVEVCQAIMDDSAFDRDGAELADPGLFVALEPWQFYLLTLG